MKDQQTCNLASSGVILLLGYRRYCGSFLRKWQWKIIPFQVHRVFSQRKILMIRILILILSRIVLKKRTFRYFKGVVSIDFISLLENPISVSASNGNSWREENRFIEYFSNNARNTMAKHKTFKYASLKANHSLSVFLLQTLIEVIENWSIIKFLMPAAAHCTAPRL